MSIIKRAYLIVKRGALNRRGKRTKSFFCPQNGGTDISSQKEKEKKFLNNKITIFPFFATFDRASKGRMLIDDPDNASFRPLLCVFAADGKEWSREK